VRAEASHYGTRTGSSPNFLFAPLGGDPLHALFTY
jgi:hypothetical protein